MRKRFIPHLLVSGAVVFVMAMVPLVVFAHETNGENTQNTTNASDDDNNTESHNSDGTHQRQSELTSEQKAEKEHKLREAAEARKAELKAKEEENKLLREQKKVTVDRRLTANKLNICRKRQAAISNVMMRSFDRAQKQITLFTTISTRVQTFYTSKGKTLSNYSELVAAVNAAKAKAETDLQAISGNSTFKCDSLDPKGGAAAFKGALLAEVRDLKEYRTALKNLIKGVKSVNSEANSTGGGQ